ncbi:DUF1583 domain-containing protein [bacterium]|nr:DUF1583 domain-containing protein [bacterium]
MRFFCCVLLLTVPSLQLAQGDELPVADQQAINSIFGDEFLAENVGTVRHRAAALPADEQVDFLASWVLPRSGHGFRVTGEFTQSEAAPSAQTSGGRRRARLRTARPSEAAPSAQTSGEILASQGSIIVSPVFDLLDAASLTNRLVGLRDRILSTPESVEPSQQRARAALLALVLLQLNESKAADAALGQLRALVNGQKPETLQEQWPETLVVYRGVHRTASNEAIGDLLLMLREQRTGQGIPAGLDQWHTHIAALIGKYQYVINGGSPDAFEKPAGLAHWIPTSVKQAHTRGRGNAAARWIPTGPSEVTQLAGHSNEYLLFQSPLRGNFEVQGQIGPAGVCNFYAAGEYVGPHWDRQQIQIGTVRRGVVRHEPIDPPLARFRAAPRFRAVFRDGEYRLFINGRLVRTTQLDEQSDPWIGLHSRWQGAANASDVRISGQPEIPESVLMSASKELTGWVQYNDESVGGNGAHWEYIETSDSSGEILGRKRLFDAAGTLESLLRYQRPLIEDGAVEYEFFYEPGAGRTLAHPTLDRLAFLLEPDGVRIHWITDGRFNQTDLRPDNRFDEPENRRGPPLLPFRPGEWNRLRIAIEGRTVTLELNGQQIYERELEIDNDRTFGLFHFSDQSQLRVRNVVMRGDWPKTLPSATDQQLADPTVAQIDAGLPKLRSEFVHDFVVDGMPGEFFKSIGHNPQQAHRVTSDGLQFDISSSADWRYIAVSPQFQMHGDFDVEAQFENLDIDARKFSTIQIGTRIHDDPSLEPRILRFTGPGEEQFLRSQLLLRKSGTPDRSQAVGTDSDNESTSGRLRLARRGSIVYSLFAEGDSEQFRLIGQVETSRNDVLFDGINLYGVAGGGGSRVRVAWRSLRLRAEKLMHLPGENTSVMRALYVFEVPQVDQLRDPDIPLWKQYTQMRMKQFQLTATGENGDEVAPAATLIGESRQGSSSHGVLGLWTDNVGRPVAIGTAIALGLLDAESLREVDEFHSLHSGPIRMKDGDREVWNVVAPGLVWKVLPDAPPPADTPDELFAQAKKLTQRFTAETGARGRRGPTLQSEPLHRFSFKSEGGLCGGVLMAWSIETNPESLLALEVRPDDDGRLKWHFAGANYSSSGQFLLLDGQLAWSESPARFGGRIEHLGWFTDNVNLEASLVSVIPTKIDEVLMPRRPFRQLGSPQWSPDGRSAVIDLSEGDYDTSRVVVINVDGSGMRDLGPGCLPSFSPDGKQIVFSVLNGGVLTMNADGSERRMLEPTGFGAEWSPDGRFIGIRTGRNIVLAELQTGNRRNLLTDEQAADVRYLYWNFDWSPDSRSIVFKFNSRSGETIAVAGVDVPNQLKVLHTASRINPDLSWHPDGTRILFGAYDPAARQYRLFTVDRNGNAPPQPVPGQPRGWQMQDCDWSPDGRRILFNSKPLPGPVEWTTTD